MFEPAANRASQTEKTQPSVWAHTPTSAENASIEDTPSSRRRRSGRGYGLTAIITSACSIVIAVVLPHFAAIFAAAAAIFAGIGIRRSTTAASRKLALAGLILSLVVFAAAVIYTIYTVVQGFERWEQLQ